jgi:transcriptional regulator with XRE-family HTH domain
MTDRRVVSQVFRDRLLKVIGRSGMSHSAFARSIGLDRSTLAQLMSGADARLPRAETLAAIAAGCRVSVDWLLGLSQREQLGADVFGEVMQIEPHEHSPIDDRMYRWLTEAAGYKIRTVPTSFPDSLKTPAVIDFEYTRLMDSDPGREHEKAESRLAYLRRPETEFEVCSAKQAIVAMARGQGIWEGLPVGHRRAQLDHMIGLCEELYPSFRLFLYDRARTYSVPFTVFGPLRAAIYLGKFYFVFTSNEHIRVLTRRFDELVRAAVVQPPDMPAFLKSLRDAI